MTSCALFYVYAWHGMKSSQAAYSHLVNTIGIILGIPVSVGDHMLVLSLTQSRFLLEKPVLRERRLAQAGLLSSERHHLCVSVHRSVQSDVIDQRLATSLRPGGTPNYHSLYKAVGISSVDDFSAIAAA